MNETYFVEVVSVYHFYHERERKSFSLDWVKENGVALPQKLKQTRLNITWVVYLISIGAMC